MSRIYFCNKLVFIGVLIYLVAISFTVGSYFNHDIIGGMHALELSDTMYLPTLYKDLVLEGGNYSDWYLSPAPYFFPDIFLYFVASYFGGDFYVANIIFIVFQLVFLSISLLILYRFNQSLGLAVIWSSIVIIIFYMVPTSVSSLLVKGAWHYGVTLSGVLILAILVRSLAKEYVKKNGVWLFIVSLLTVASDKLFLLQFLAPVIFSLTVIWFYKKLPTKKYVQILLTLFFSVFGGLILAKILVLNQTAYPINYSFYNVGENSIKLFDKFLKYYDYNPTIAIINISIALFLWGYALAALIGKLKNQSVIVIFCSVFYASMFALIVSVLLLSDIEMANRYLIPIFMLPIILIPTIFGEKVMSLGYEKIVIFFGIATAVCSLGWTIYKFQDYKYHSEYYPKYMQCVDNFLTEKKADYGIANYWVSKRFSMLNKTGFKVVNTNPNLKVIHRISTAGWDQKKYDFVIVNNRWKNNPKIDLIMQRNNQPDFLKTKCNFIDVYHFENGISLK